ncbi:MAG TPA: hypothetical protein VFC05_13925 [Nitrososphaeraceae archaeon]|nr:hypothetical protein [Nitrososphaeraceae archaeon]
MKLDTVLPSETFRGMSYGDWIAAWHQWLVSDNPSYNGEDILFLRGNVNYRSVGDKEDDDGPRYLDPKAVYDRTKDNGETIYEGTAILIPILTSHFYIGDFYNGRKITSIPYLRYVTNKDTNGGSVWATIMKKGGRVNKIVSDLKEYRFESPLYLLSIPRNSKLRNKMDYPPNPGNYHAITVGYFVLIKFLSIGTYTLRFGGTNGSAYHTNSIYDIYILKKRKDNVVDKSDHIKY